MPSSLWPRCTGQVGLLFPIGAIFVHFFGGIDYFFRKQTADDILAREAAFRACFTSAEGFGYCLGTLAVFVALYCLYVWVGKNSIAANWINIILALALVVWAVVFTALYGINNPWGIIVVLGWTIFAVIGLYQSYTVKSV